MGRNRMHDPLTIPAKKPEAQRGRTLQDAPFLSPMKRSPSLTLFEVVHFRAVNCGESARPLFVRVIQSPDEDLKNQSDMINPLHAISKLRNFKTRASS